MHSHLAKMLGTYIVERRDRFDILQKELAERIETSPQFLGRIERGEVMIPIHLLKRCIVELSLSEKRLVTIFRMSGAETAQDILDEIKSEN